MSALLTLLASEICDLHRFVNDAYHLFQKVDTDFYYRAMHVVLAWYFCRKLSICLSVTWMYREYIGWTSLKLIT